MEPIIDSEDEHVRKIGTPAPIRKAKIEPKAKISLEIEPSTNMNYNRTPVMAN